MSGNLAAAYLAGAQKNLEESSGKSVSEAQAMVTVALAQVAIAIALELATIAHEIRMLEQITSGRR